MATRAPVNECLVRDQKTFVHEDAALRVRRLRRRTPGKQNTGESEASEQKSEPGGKRHRLKTGSGAGL